MKPETKRLTTTAGIPVGDNQNSLTAGPRGPVLMQDFHLIEKMAHFNRERIPERDDEFGRSPGRRINPAPPGISTLGLVEE